jgi:hypothetical protein
VSAAPASTAPALRRAGRRTRTAAAIVLIGLAALAYYAMFSGPTTVPLPAGPQGAAHTRTAPDRQGEPAEGRGD